MERRTLEGTGLCKIESKYLRRKVSMVYPGSFLESPNGALESCDCFVGGGQWMGKPLIVLMRSRRAK